MPANVTDNEIRQLEQTIEMFEVIVQSQPNDYQSLEILKEAYFKLERQQDVINTSKRMAQAYVQSGQLSSAILEYESILQQYPNDPAATAALAEVVNRATTLAASLPIPEIDTPGSTMPAKPSASALGLPHAVLGAVEDGKQVWEKLLVDGKFLNASDFGACWPKVSDNGGTVGDPFLKVLHEKSIFTLDKSLKLVSDRARITYIPIEKYDVDVDLARTFPKDSCLRWSVLPFDRMSKAVFVATANPFNRQAAKELEEATKYRLIWYLANPQDLVKVIKKTFRIVG